jgi:DNA ligase-1
MEFHELVEVSQRISETSRRLEKIGLLAGFLRRLAPDEIPIAVSYLSGNLTQGKIGIGYASLRDAAAFQQLSKPLTLSDVDAAFRQISETAGPGSSAVRLQLVQNLMARADARERDFLCRLIIGELRQGSLEGIMIEALARAADVPVERMRTAVKLSGNLLLAARTALEEGISGLAQFKIQILHPFQPMLAQSTDTLSEAMDSIRIAALEYKMDGIRIQAHKQGKEIRFFTRNLNDVTKAVPDLSEILLEFPAQEMVLDGEALVIGREGKPRRFQDTMRRFGRKLNVPELRKKLPLTPSFFDCLYVDGDSLIEKSEGERLSVLEKIAPPEYLMPRRISSEPDAAEAFLLQSMNAGHEGVMVKDPEASYEPGVRSNHWLKVKPAHTLDLVVLAAEWGHGRRRGRLSNLHLGARDPESGQFIMLGKTFKGLTDAMLEWQTNRLLELESSRDQWTVYVRPELVVEIVFNDIQSSPHYPAGLALRFARVKGYRTDKNPEQADTIQTVRAIAAKSE